MRFDTPSDRITAQHNDKHHDPVARCAVCQRESEMTSLTPKTAPACVSPQTGT